MEIEKVDKDKDDESGMKKQVRRRLHSNKPYKERLLNMAEARREIVTALKFHRASMNQKQAEAGAGTNHHQHPVPPLEQQGKSNSNSNNYMGTYSALIPHHHYPISTIVPPPPPLHHHQHLNLALPNQTLGLTLNFQDFSDLPTSIYHTPMPVAAKEVAANSSGDVVIGGLHDPMESDEMKEIISLNLVTSTRLKTIEIGPKKVTKAAGCDHEDDDDDDDGGYHPFEQVMEFPPWLINANESSCLQQVNDHHFSDDYSPDPALPWMDIGEIEGMDGWGVEWSG